MSNLSQNEIIIFSLCIKLLVSYILHTRCVMMCYTCTCKWGCYKWECEIGTAESCYICSYILVYPQHKAKMGCAIRTTHYSTVEYTAQYTHKHTMCIIFIVNRVCLLPRRAALEVRHDTVDTTGGSAHTHTPPPHPSPLHWQHSWGTNNLLSLSRCTMWMNWSMAAISQHHRCTL